MNYENNIHKSVQLGEIGELWDLVPVQTVQHASAGAGSTLAGGRGQVGQLSASNLSIKTKIPADKGPSSRSEWPLWCTVGQAFYPIGCDSPFRILGERNSRGGHFRLQHIYQGNLMPESTLTLCQNRLWIWPLSSTILLLYTPTKNASFTQGEQICGCDWSAPSIQS
jgi:hypothetical protein